MNFYKEELTDHFKNPRNYGVLEDASIKTEEHNPSCGDSVQLQLLVQDDVVKKIAFTGKGCVISLAAASMLTQKVLGMNLNSILEISNDTIAKMVSIPLGPTRLKCALLSLNALQNGIREYLKEA